MSRLLALLATVIACVAVTVAICERVDLLGTPPPPYTDPNLATTNALGGVGRTQGWTVTVTSGATVNLLSDAVIPADIKADVEAATNIPRFVTVERLTTSTAATDETVCARLGPSTNTPALSCLGLNDSDASTGGCYLVADGKGCQFTERPIRDCDSSSYASCAQPIWAIASASQAIQVHVQVAW